MYKNGGKIPKKYTQKLSRKDKKKQIKNIKTTKKAYKNKMGFFTSYWPEGSKRPDVMILKDSKLKGQILKVF